MLEVEFEEEAHRLIPNDPVNHSGLNFKVETYPMLGAVTRSEASEVESKQDD